MVKLTGFVGDKATTYTVDLADITYVKAADGNVYKVGSRAYESGVYVAGTKVAKFAVTGTHGTSLTLTPVLSAGSASLTASTLSDTALIKGTIFFLKKDANGKIVGFDFTAGTGWDGNANGAAQNLTAGMKSIGSVQLTANTVFYVEHMTGATTDDGSQIKSVSTFTYADFQGSLDTSKNTAVTIWSANNTATYVVIDNTTYSSGFPYSGDNTALTTKIAVVESVTEDLNGNINSLKLVGDDTVYSTFNSTVATPTVGSIYEVSISKAGTVTSILAHSTTVTDAVDAGTDNEPAIDLNYNTIKINGTTNVIDAIIVNYYYSNDQLALDDYASALATF